MTELGEFAKWLAIGGVLVTLLVGPIGKALARRISGGKSPEALPGISTGEVTADRVAVLEERLAELEAERLQTEERLDFAERLLVRGRSESPSEVESP